MNKTKTPNELFFEQLEAAANGIKAFDGFEAVQMSPDIISRAGMANMSATASDGVELLSMSGKVITAKINVSMAATGGNNLPRAYAAIFGYSAAMSNYSRVPAVIPGVSIIGTLTRASENLVLVSENGAAVQQEIEISTNEVPYLAVLGNLASAKFKIAGIRAQTNNPLQLAESITIHNQSLFGREERNSVRPADFVTPEQNIPGIVNIPLNIEMDKYKTMIIPFRSDIAGLTYNLSIYIQYFDL